MIKKYKTSHNLIEPGIDPQGSSHFLVIKINFGSCGSDKLYTKLTIHKGKGITYNLGHTAYQQPRTENDKNM